MFWPYSTALVMHSWTWAAPGTAGCEGAAPLPPALLLPPDLRALFLLPKPLLLLDWEPWQERRGALVDTL